MQNTFLNLSYPNFRIFSITLKKKWFQPRQLLKMAEGQVLVLDGWDHLLSHQWPSWFFQVSEKAVFVWYEGINMLSVSTEISWSIWCSSTNNEHQPSSGPYHFWVPAVGDMLLYKTKQGQDALDHLKMFAGIPPPYDKKKQMVVPAALKVLCLKPTQKCAYLRFPVHEVGWMYQVVTIILEEKRKEKTMIHHQKKQLMRLRKQAEKNIEKKIDKFTEVLKTHSFLVWAQSNWPFIPQKK